MENTIKKLYTTLSGGKAITSDDYIINRSDFTSIMRQRFVAELSKNGIPWNGENVAFYTLLSKQPSEITGTVNLPPKTEKNTPASRQGFSVGIDIQNIADLPICRDYWEDTFYKLNFKPEEIAYCLNKDNPRESFAGIYSCKEALVKCNNQLQWDEIKISHTDNGKPEFNGYFISISHSGEFVVSIAIKNEINVVSSNSQPVSQPVTKSETDLPVLQIKSKNYNKIFFASILVIVVYIIIKDFIIK